MQFIVNQKINLCSFSQAVKILVAMFLASCSAGKIQTDLHEKAVDIFPTFNYSDLDAFAEAYRAFDRGTNLESAMQMYLENTSAAYPFYADRYDATAKSIAEEIRKRPKYYARLVTLKPHLQKYETAIAGGIKKLNALAPGNKPAPIFFIVGNMTAGGSPSELNPPIGAEKFGITVAVEAVSMADDVDMSEFPDRYSGGYLADIPYVVVHEMMHVYQARAQGIENYRSIYRSGPNNTYLALAVREGCADYVTYLCTGLMRTGNRHEYGLAHEKELWSKFSEIMHTSASFENGWFGRIDPRTPDWPPQIGYWVGMRMCEAYHQTANDRGEAIRRIFSDYSAKDMVKFAESYARKMKST